MVLFDDVVFVPLVIATTFIIFYIVNRKKPFRVVALNCLMTVILMALAIPAAISLWAVVNGIYKEASGS